MPRPTSAGALDDRGHGDRGVVGHRLGDGRQVDHVVGRDRLRRTRGSCPRRSGRPRRPRRRSSRRSPAAAAAPASTSRQVSTTAPSTHPPDTLPSTVPSGCTATAAPGPRGADAEVSTTVASANVSPAACQRPDLVEDVTHGASVTHRAVRGRPPPTPGDDPGQSSRAARRVPGDQRRRSDGRAAAIPPAVGANPSRPARGLAHTTRCASRASRAICSPSSVDLAALPAVRQHHHDRPAGRARAGPTRRGTPSASRPAGCRPTSRGRAGPRPASPGRGRAGPARG